MLNIRVDQVKILLEDADRRLQRDIAKHLRWHFSKQIERLNGAALHTLVVRSIEQARSFGLTARRDLFRFANLAVLYGRDFAREQAWMGAILSDHSVSIPSTRLKLLIDECLHRMYVTRRNRDLARQRHERGSFQRAGNVTGAPTSALAPARSELEDVRRV